MKHFHYGEIQPSPGLAEHVLAYWSFEVSLPHDREVVHHVWPDGCVSLSVATQVGRVLTCTLVGPRVHAIRIPVRGGVRYRGIRLWPDTAASVFGVAPAQLRDQHVSAAAMLGSDTSAFAANVARSADEAAFVSACEDWLATRVASAPRPDHVVRAAVRALIASDGTRPITEIAAAVGLSVRQLERRFRAAIALTPKQFARVRRVRAAIGVVLAGQRSWSRVAAEVGFADHAHLAREFRAITGFTPRTFISRLDAIEHGSVQV